MKVNGEVNIASNLAIVRILKNNGDGTFAPATDYSPSRNFADMKLPDINGDGFVDLIFAPDGNFPPYHIGTALFYLKNYFLTAVYWMYRFWKRPSSVSVAAFGVDSP